MAKVAGIRRIDINNSIILFFFPSSKTAKEKKSHKTPSHKLQKLISIRVLITIVNYEEWFVCFNRCQMKFYAKATAKSPGVEKRALRILLFRALMCVDFLLGLVF